MLLRDKELRGLPVVTESGRKIGKLAGLVVDAGSHSVARYLVAKSRLLSALLPAELLVHPSQVVSVDEEKMTVKDSAVAVEAASAVRVSETAAAE